MELVPTSDEVLALLRQTGALRQGHFECLNGLHTDLNLETALAMTPQADHVHYALALAQALGGDLETARDHLERAIELEPRNRLIARQDADFSAVARHPMFDTLLYPGKKGW